MGHVLVGVVEVDGPVFSLQCEPALSQIHLCMILCVPTSVRLSVDYIPQGVHRPCQEGTVNHPSL